MKLKRLAQDNNYI